MKSNNNKKLVELDSRVKQVGGTLIIKEAKVDDSGKYLCMVNNSVGGESVETVLTVTGTYVYTEITRPNELISKNISRSSNFSSHLSIHECCDIKSVIIREFKRRCIN